MIIINQEEMVITMSKKKSGFVIVAILGMLISGCKAELTDFQDELTKMNEIIQNEESEIFKEDYMIVSRRKEEYRNEERIIKRDGENYYLKEMVDYANGSRDVSETWYIKAEGNIYIVYESRSVSLTYREVSATSYEVTSLNVLLNHYESYYNEASNIIKNVCAKDNVVCGYSKGIFGNRTIEVTTTEDKYVTVRTITIKKGKLKGATTEVTGEVNVVLKLTTDRLKGMTVHIDVVHNLEVKTTEIYGLGRQVNDFGHHCEMCTTCDLVGIILCTFTACKLCCNRTVPLCSFFSTYKERCHRNCEHQTKNYCNCLHHHFFHDINSSMNIFFCESAIFCSKTPKIYFTY